MGYKLGLMVYGLGVRCCGLWVRGKGSGVQDAVLVVGVGV